MVGSKFCEALFRLQFRNFLNLVVSLSNVADSIAIHLMQIRLQDALDLFLHLSDFESATMRKPSQKLLLYGPSGCGKTLLGCALAGVSHLEKLNCRRC